MNRGGQLKISFGMIFSIILIIMFLSFGFYAISGFLDLQDSVKSKKFIENFQGEVDKMWNSQLGSKDVKFSLPSSVEKICFVDRLKNLEVHSEDYFDEIKIEHIDTEKTLDGDSSLCIKTVKEKVEFRITKEYGENAVTVKKIEDER